MICQAGEADQLTFLKPLEKVQDIKGCQVIDYNTIHFHMALALLLETRQRSEPTSNQIKEL